MSNRNAKGVVCRRFFAVLLAVALGIASPLGAALAQTPSGNEPTEAACEPLTVLDFITDASGQSVAGGDIVASQYRAWGVGISAADAEGRPALVLAAELPSSTGPVNAVQVGNGIAGTLTLQFQSLLSVEAVKLVNVTGDGAAVVVHDNLSQAPAVVPIGAAKPGEVEAVSLSMLGAATRLDLRLVAGSAVSEVVLCPQSTPKSVPRYQAPRLAVELSSSKAELTPGENTEVTVKVRNLGGAVGYDLTLWQRLPPGLAFADDGLSERTWELGAVGPDGSYILGYPVKATAEATTGLQVSHLVAMISNGRGAEGVASAPLTLQVRGGRVLGVETEEAPAAPVPPPQPKPSPSPTPEEATPVPPAKEPAKEPAEVTPPKATPTPVPTPAAEATKPAEAESLGVGGPEEEVDESETAAAPTSTEETAGAPEREGEQPFTLATPGGEPLLEGPLGTTTATTTAGAVACTSWLWLLIIVNAVLIGLLAQRERKAGSAGTRWVVAMLVAAVPLIIWYPACELNWWLVITAAGTGVMLYATGKPGASGGEVSLPPAPPGHGT